jgi:CBS domain-containing protein
MTPKEKVITVNEDQTRQQAARLLSEHNISGLPVVNHEQIVVGIVTEFDVIAKKGRLVRDIMTRGIISVTSETDLEEVRRILISERIRRLLVIDQGRLVGIISRSDLIKEVAKHYVCPICGELMHMPDPPRECLRCGTQENATEPELVAPGF